MINSLKDRVKYYENLLNPEILKKLPIVIIVNGRGFKKTTSLLEKPFCSDFMEAMCATMVKLFQEIGGSTFGYCFNDEIIIVSRNDNSNGTEAWCENNVQKITSLAASIATYEFNKFSNSTKLFGDALFSAKVFAVPTITEVINVLIHKQQQAFHNAISKAAFYELIKKYDVEKVKETLSEKSSEEKLELLWEECSIKFSNYPLPFRLGVASYRAPKVVAVDGAEEIRNKITINMEIPSFTKDKEFLSNIFRGGQDIFRAK